LDPRSRASLWACVSGLHDRGTTVFLTTHYLEEADVLCDRLMIIDHGQVVAVSTPRELKREVLGDAIAITSGRTARTPRVPCPCCGSNHT
jgi:ABC-2 type transport system ATP-binding protein